MDEPIILDVRDAEKYQAKHVKGAQSFSYTQILAGQSPNLAKGAPIVCYCGSGNKAKRMKVELEKQGFTNVTSTSLPSLEKSGKEVESK